MKIKDLFKQKKVVLSYELFPPKPSSPVEIVKNTISEIKGLNPDYVSITYGAGGSGNKSRTAELAALVKDSGILPLPHLTAIHSTAAEIDARLAELAELGLENVLALRGDIRPELPVSSDFRYASDLTKYIVRHSKLAVSGACYPEGHFECESLDVDIENLKRKVDEGVSHLNTQLFFDNEDFYIFIEKIRKAGITVPVQAGIMPIINKNQIERIISLSGVKMPARFSKLVARYGDKGDALKAAGIAYASQQIIDLIANDAQGIHLYIMNNAALAKHLTENIRSVVEGINAE